jgi:hypothetical protein
MMPRHIHLSKLQSHDITWQATAIAVEPATSVTSSTAIADDSTLCLNWLILVHPAMQYTTLSFYLYVTIHALASMPSARHGKVLSVG